MRGDLGDVRGFFAGDLSIRKGSVCLVHLFLFQRFRDFVPERRATFVSAKVAKTIDPPSGLFGGEGRELFEERPNSPGSDKGR